MTELIELIISTLRENIIGNDLLLFSIVLTGIFTLLIFMRLEKWALLIIPLPLIITLANLGIPNGWFKYGIFMVLGVFWFMMFINIFKN